MLLRLSLIALGGAIGAPLRYLTTIGMARLLGTNFPFGTLTVNTLGSFLIGLLSMVFLRVSGANNALSALFLVGFLGAYTTFSSFAIETQAQFIDKGLLLALVNVFLNVALCLVGVYLGSQLGRMI